MTGNINYKTNGKIRLIAMIVLVAIITVMLCSSCFIIKEADHDCYGASCSICAAIQQCEYILKQSGLSLCVITIAVVVLNLFCQLIMTDYTDVSTYTLINSKVRLNN